MGSASRANNVYSRAIYFNCPIILNFQLPHYVYNVKSGRCYKGSVCMSPTFIAKLAIATDNCDTPKNSAYQNQQAFQFSEVNSNQKNLKKLRTEKENRIENTLRWNFLHLFLIRCHSRKCSRIFDCLKPKLNIKLWFS